jgi:antitoxin ParD1/3/4
MTMTINVPLNPQLEAIVNQKIASGMYHSASEVVGEALHLLETVEAYNHIRAAKLEALRRDIAIGIEELEQGKGSPLNIEDIIRRNRERLKTQKDKE